MILARILAPDQFGLMALVMAAGSLFEVLADVGLREAIIQNKRGDTREFLNVAWWFSAARGLLLYGVGIALIPVISSFYNEPQLEALLRVSFLTMIFSGLTSPRMYALQKSLQFGRYTLITQGAALAGTLLSLAAAFALRNVWALVLGLVAEAVFRCLGSFVLCPLRPKLAWDRDSAAELYRFSRGMFGLSFLTFITSQADVLTLGWLTSKAILGQYALAVQLANIPVMLFSRIGQPLIMPIFASLQDEPVAMGQYLRRITEMLFLVGIPSVVTLSFFAPVILRVVYGPTYVAMAVPYMALSVYGLLLLSASLIASTYMALGSPHRHRRFMVVFALSEALLIYPLASHWGPTGAALSLPLSLVVATVPQLYRIRVLLKLEFGTYLKTTLPGLGIAVVLLALLIVLPLALGGVTGDAP